MAYRNKEDCLREAKRLGIKAEGMDWPTLQKTVSNALKAEELGLPVNNHTVNLVNDVREAVAEVTMEQEAVRVPTQGKKVMKKKRDPLLPYLDKFILMSPELSPERYRLVKYDEDLGPEMDVVERTFDINRETDQVYDVSGGEVPHENQIDTYHDYTTGTYRIKNRSDRRVMGMASVPKENPMLSFRPGIDWATVVTFKGKSGYLWKHWRYPNVSGLLKAAGDEYYQKYRKVFKDQPNVWYACGHLVCDPYLVHRVLKEIEDDAKERAVKQRAMKERLGIGGTPW